MSQIKKQGYYLEDCEPVVLNNADKVTYIQYRSKYNNWKNNIMLSYSSGTHNFILHKTDGDIYLFGNFAALLTSFLNNSKDMILNKLNKVILVDIKAQYLPVLRTMFIDNKDVIKFEKPYISTNNSSMVLLLLDLTKIYKKDKTIIKK